MLCIIFFQTTVLEEKGYTPYSAERNAVFLRKGCYFNYMKRSLSGCETSISGKLDRRWVRDTFPILTTVWNFYILIHYNWCLHPPILRWTNMLPPIPGGGGRSLIVSVNLTLRVGSKPKRSFRSNHPGLGLDSAHISKAPQKHPRTL